MINIGKYNEMTVLKILDFGIYMDGGDGLEILMPKRYVPEGTEIDDKINCFVYLDSEDRLLATTETPVATVGEFALLKVNSVNRIGAFLDWGVSKELLVPFREQKTEMIEGRSYLVYIYLDVVSERIAASAKLNKFIDNVPPLYEKGQEVDVIIYQETDLGFKVIVNGTHSGMIYHNQIFTSLNIGDKLKAYVKEVRSDEKIDLSLQPFGYENVVKNLESFILSELEKNNGFLGFNDTTDPEIIKQRFQCSKKNFKKTLGALYKQKKIEILDNGIKLL